jgi:trehalose 6-phosphate phosphatase
MTLVQMAPASRAGGVSLPPEVRRALGPVARTPRLLVACDYDGTLAPIVADPWSVRPLPEAVAFLRSLACMPDTTVAVISGRALRELAVMSRLPSEVNLVGSHGSEFDTGFIHGLDAELRALHVKLVSSLNRLAARVPGAVLEVKPASVAVHVRQADDAQAARLLARIRSGPARWRGVAVTQGVAVLELSVVRSDKGEALDVVRHRCSATATLFVGDDVSAEEVFVRLSGPDLGIKVGQGATLAGYRIAGPAEVAAVLSYLAEERHSWLYGASAPLIERLTMLGSGRSVALLTPEGRICWQCVPGPASSAVFADLLGGASAGHFSIRPASSRQPLGQRYVPDTMTVETRWPGLIVTDYLDPHTPPYRTDLIRVISGSVAAVIDFAPRPEFGQVAVTLEQIPDGLVVGGTADPIVLRSPGTTWDIVSDGEHPWARAVVEPSLGQPVVLELRCGSDDRSPHSLPEPTRRELADAHWSNWVATLSLPTVETALVRRSALTLRALCNAETGGIMAAATTSLPEEVGGVRNWDYRHCWLRDGAMTAAALVSLGSTGEAIAFLDWVHRVIAGLPGPERLHPVYTLDGSPLGPEAIISSLPGYVGSRPVRIGNLAAQQVQLDVFGPVVGLIEALAARLGHLREADWRLAVAMCEAVARRWHEPDYGIWESPTPPRHHVHSKIMCWVAIDRTIRLAERYREAGHPGWPELRETIRAEVLDNGWNERVQSFTTAYNVADLDASCLQIGLSGLLDAADTRFQSTVAAVEAELRAACTVYRYHHDDGLPGREGGFHLCTSWLIEAYLLTGRNTDAEELFKQMVSTAGPTGLLSEEYDPVAERSLGNYPQAYSHLGLIRCAQLLDSGTLG